MYVNMVSRDIFLRWYRKKIRVTGAQISPTLIVPGQVTSTRIACARVASG